MRDGRKTSFWHEAWSSLGCFVDILDGRCFIEMGIPSNEVVSDSRSHRKRDHRIQILNTIEMEIDKYKSNIKEEEDITLWKNGRGKYKRVFSSGETW